MTRRDDTLRDRILDQLADGPKTDKQIAGALGFASEFGVRSCLLGMERAGQVRRGRPGATYKPVRWRRSDEN